eukprot:1194281-Prorocentrum_minimum.AAC.9
MLLLPHFTGPPPCRVRCGNGRGAEIHPRAQAEGQGPQILRGRCGGPGSVHPDRPARDGVVRPERHRRAMVRPLMIINTSDTSLAHAPSELC